MIRIVNGDVSAATENIIAHQVNCMGVQGSGVAKVIKEKYPKEYDEYKEYCKTLTPYELLGKCQIVTVGEDKYVANLFGQLNYGRTKYRYTDYDALKEAFKYLSDFAAQGDHSIALPYKVGCGLANGEWSIVYPMIEEIFDEQDVTLYKWS